MSRGTPAQPETVSQEEVLYALVSRRQAPGAATLANLAHDPDDAGGIDAELPPQAGGHAVPDLVWVPTVLLPPFHQLSPLLLAQAGRPRLSGFLPPAPLPVRPVDPLPRQA